VQIGDEGSAYRRINVIERRGPRPEEGQALEPELTLQALRSSAQPITRREKAI
jgi:hypothetical protein